MTLLAKKLNQLGLSQQEIADKAKVSQPYVSAVLKGKVLKYNATKKFAEAFGFDLMELVADFDHLEISGHNISQKAKELDAIQFEESSVKESTQPLYIPTPQKFANKKFKKEVTIIPAKAQLGLKSFLYPEEMMNELETRTIYVDQDYKGKYYEIECVGDSMDADHRNAIRNGDTVLCREISKLHWQNPFHKNDWEFVFFHNEYGIIIKSIKEQNLENGNLVLCSYNPDKEEYPDFTINIKDCYAICNVVQVVQNRKKYYTL